MSQTPDIAITDRARASLDRMMLQGLRHGIAGDAPDADIAAADLPARPAATHMAVLSIASYTFRIITALHFAPSPALRDHIAQLGRQSPDAMTHQDFIDAVCESANMCCGAINRDLGMFYNGLGLSTPQILDIRSLPHMQRLGAQHLRHFRIGLPGGLGLHASLCVRAYEPMDFDWHPQEPAVGAGELELF